MGLPIRSYLFRDIEQRGLGDKSCNKEHRREELRFPSLIPHLLQNRCKSTSSQTQSSKPHKKCLPPQDINKTTVTGLEPSPYHDKITKNPFSPPSKSPISISSETDRVYASDASHLITVLENGKPRLEITRDMLPDVVVWNPWEAKAKSMPDFGPEGAWNGMVCVEAGSVRGWNTLEAGETWEGGQRMKALL